MRVAGARAPPQAGTDWINTAEGKQVLAPARRHRPSGPGADRSRHSAGDPATLQQMLRVLLHQQGALNAENDVLRLLIQRLTRQQFGRRSEQLTPDQLQFGLEDLEQTIAENQAGQDEVEPAAPGKPAGANRPARNLGALPAHLPRFEVVIDAAPKGCPCCGGTMHSIGELRTEQLDIVPAQLRVRVTRRRAMPAALARAPWWWPKRPPGRSMAAWRPKR